MPRSVYITDTLKYEIYDWEEGYDVIPKRERRIAGSKRVAQYQSEQSRGKGSGQLLQSITAHPALSTRSFEELRVECYAQSVVAQGKSVNAATTPETVIPPFFSAYHDKTEDVLPNEITMAD